MLYVFILSRDNKLCFSWKKLYLFLKIVSLMSSMLHLRNKISGIPNLEIGPQKFDL